MTNGGTDKRDTRFDLVARAQSFSASSRVYRYALFVVAAFMIVSIIDSVVTDIIPGKGGAVRSLTIGTDVFLTCILAFVLWGGFFFLSPSAESVEITPDAVILRYSRGRSVVLNWSDPALKIRLRQFTPAVIGFSGPSRPDAFTLWGRWYKYNRINREVADGIILAARDHGLQVRQQSSKGDGGTITRTVVTPH